MSPRDWYVDGLGQFLGLVHEAPGRIRMPVREDLLNAGGLLAGPVLFALADYAMGSALWEELGEEEGMATINVSVNFVSTAREGDVLCVVALDRRTRGAATLSGDVRASDGRLLATAIGSYTIFPRQALKGPPAGLRPAYGG